MLCNCSYGKTHFIFEVDDNGFVLVNKLGAENAATFELARCPVCRIHETGNLNWGQVGSVHTGSSGEYTLKYKTHRVYENSLGQKVEIVISDEKMAVTVHFQMYKDVCGVRSFCEVENISDEKVGLEYVSTLSLCLFSTVADSKNDNISIYIPYNKWCQEANWKKKSLRELGIETLSCSTVKRFGISNTGHWSSKEYLPMGGFEDTKTKNSAIWQLESNGSWSWEIIPSREGNAYLSATGPNESDSFWYKELKKGEKFVSVTGGITFGCDFNEALGELTKYRRHIIADRGADGNNPVIFNDYMNCLMADPDDKKVRELIDLASSLGCEYYMMDAGWYAKPAESWWGTVGEWKENRLRFPDGIKALSDYAASKGLKFGLWLEIEVMGVNCPILSDFEDECFIMRHGKRIVNRGRYHFDFRNRHVYDYVTSVVDRVVNEYGVSYIKFDHNIDPGMGTELDADSFGDGLLGHCRALVKWKEDIRKKYPHLIVESCSSGGLRTDYATLSTGHLQSVSDQEKKEQNPYLASLCPTSMLPEQCGMWSYPLPGDSENDVITAMVNTLMVRPYISGKLHLMDEKSRERVKEAIALYKTLREEVSKALPFYPLGLTQYGDKYLCTAYRCPDKNYLCVWHLDGEDDEKFIPFENAKEVKILYPSHCSYGKAEICEGGIKVTLPKNTAFLLLTE